MCKMMSSSISVSVHAHMLHVTELVWPPMVPADGSSLPWAEPSIPSAASPHRASQTLASGWGFVEYAGWLEDGWPTGSEPEGRGSLPSLVPLRCLAPSLDVKALLWKFCLIFYPCLSTVLF